MAWCADAFAPEIRPGSRCATWGWGGWVGLLPDALEGEASPSQGERGEAGVRGGNAGKLMA